MTQEQSGCQRLNPNYSKVSATPCLLRSERKREGQAPPLLRSSMRGRLPINDSGAVRMSEIEPQLFKSFSDAMPFEIGTQKGGPSAPPFAFKYEGETAD